MDLFALVLLFVALLARVSAELMPDASRDTFQQLREDNRLVLAAFTSKSVDSELPFHAAFASAAEDSETPFVTIDCAEEAEWCKELDVNAYPAVRLFKGDEMVRYRGKKTSSA